MPACHWAPHVHNQNLVLRILSTQERRFDMKAAYIKQPGPPDAIIYGDLPQPVPTGSQVLVRVGAVAVNPIDTYIPCPAT